MNVQKTIPVPVAESGYEEDFVLWCERQASLLEARDHSALDWEHLVEEIGDMAGRDRNEVTNRLRLVLLHLYKLALSHMTNPFNGWRSTVREQRAQIAALFEQSPSLTNHAHNVLPAMRDKALRQALADLADHEPANPERYRRAAAALPEWTLDRILDEDFFPETPDET